MTSNNSSQSPLLEATASSLDELFSKAPPYSDDEVRRIVEEYRRKRENFKVSEAMPRAKKSVKVVSKEEIDIDGLGL